MDMKPIVIVCNKVSGGLVVIPFKKIDYIFKCGDHTRLVFKTYTIDVEDTIDSILKSIESVTFIAHPSNDEV